MGCFSSSVVLTVGATALPAADWPAWRGPAGTGVSTEATLPLRWSATENVKWRVPLPEPGNSTPVVWGERVFVTQAVGDRRTLMCFNRADGRLRWQQGITTAQREPTHATNPYCSGSPVTDGERAIAAFASDGLFCFDLDARALDLLRPEPAGRTQQRFGGRERRRTLYPHTPGALVYRGGGPRAGALSRRLKSEILALDFRPHRSRLRAERKRGRA